MGIVCTPSGLQKQREDLINIGLRRPKVKAKELLGWIMFVLLIGALLIVGYALEPSVSQWVREQRAVVNAPIVEPIQAQQPVVSTDVTTSPKVEESKKVLTAEVLLLPDSTNYDEKVAYCKTYTATFGKMGTFYGVYDSNLETCVLGAWESNRIDTSDWAFTLADLKETGDDYVFLNPWQGKINHSAETVYINSQECTPANPVRCSDGTIVFEQGATIRIVSEAGNDSSGPFLILTK